MSHPLPNAVYLHLVGVRAKTRSFPGRRSQILIALFADGLGICLQAFFLIPKTVEGLLENKMPTFWITVFAVMASVIFVGLGFWVDQLFSSFETAIVMMVLSLFFGLGAILTRSLSLTYAFFLPIMLINTLSERKYFRFPWSALLIGFVCSLGVVLHHLLKAREPLGAPG